MSTWRMPALPWREKAACSSRYSSAVATAASWHSRATMPTSPPPMAHSTDKDLGAEKVRSQPRTWSAPARTL